MPEDTGPPASAVGFPGGAEEVHQLASGPLVPVSAESEELTAEVLVVGSGFAGSLLARALAQSGRDVVLVERGRHPRLALGESSTPLANLALERLARRFGWRDVWNLAAWGRWRRHHPELRCGLKRGFTFLDGREAEPGDASVLVAASPDDEVADTQWYRADLDAALVGAAIEAGASYVDGLQIDSLEVDDAGVRAEGRRRNPEGVDVPVRIRAGFLVDGSGAGGLASRLLRFPVRRRTAIDTGLLHWHCNEVEELEIAGPAPYPAQWSAVHHLFELGWIYELRFDDGLTSLGWILDRRRCAAAGTELPRRLDETGCLELMESLLPRTPGLRDRLRSARGARPAAWIGALPWRVGRATAPRVALLPQALAFHDPMFSTGIAWSLLAVERLCDALSAATEDDRRLDLLAQYDQLLRMEADHLERLLVGAHAVLHDVEAFGWYSQVYFAAASFAESRQRLLDADECPLDDLEPALPESFDGTVPWWWRGFLGAGDVQVSDAVRVAGRWARSPTAAAELEARVPALILGHNVAGLADPRIHPRYPADAGTVVAAASRLGLTAEEARHRLPRLLGELPFEG